MNLFNILLVLVLDLDQSMLLRYSNLLPIRHANLTNTPKSHLNIQGMTRLQHTLIQLNYHSQFHCQPVQFLW